MKKYVTKVKRHINNIQIYCKLKSTKALTPVYHRSIVDNIYHCCVQKTASQWLKSIFADQRVYKYSGLISHDYERHLPEGYDARKLTEKFICKAFPKKTIIGPLYLDYASFMSIPKPEVYRAFFVTRDPRDIIISWYFSMKNTHAEMGAINPHRERLNQMPIDEGLLYCIDKQKNYGVFDTLSSWADARERDSNIVVVKFEDITGEDMLKSFKELFGYLDIQMPDDVFKSLMEDYSFARISGGRKRGQENQGSHYRKGVHGDWENYFNDETLAFFHEATGSLVDRLGY